jgi:hypothetical protein
VLIDDLFVPFFIALFVPIFDDLNAHGYMYVLAGASNKGLIPVSD